ncbi:MAG TPA: MiaB/RimO family radical SAM methylthiotransferase [Firmicutes bacterium]|nr:MiaB/RimO family radical SAM methylthiotransferase [Bacillota bacterium]
MSRNLKNRVVFFTYGCKSNKYETEKIRQMIRPPAEDSTMPADFVIINACAITETIDREILRKIKSLKRAGNSKIILTGCVPPGMEKVFSGLVDYVVPNNEKFSRESYPEELSSGWDNSGLSVLTGFSGRHRAFVKAQSGCDMSCAYCIVPLVRGSALNSRDEDEIIKEIESLNSAGFREIVLTGINLGRYGAEKNDAEALFCLVKRIGAMRGDFRARLSSIGPRELSENIIKAAAENPGRFCPHFHISAQSGDDKVLKLMGRNYTTGLYAKRIDYIMKVIPGAAINTDIIAGFPGEGEKEFGNTLDFLKKMPFSRVHIFPYSDRPGTRASRSKNKVNAQIKKQRAWILVEEGKNKEREYIEKNTGRHLTMLVETKIGGMCEGYTENYIRARVKADKAVPGGFLRVKIEGTVPGKKIIASGDAA